MKINLEDMGKTTCFLCIALFLICVFLFATVPLAGWYLSGSYVIYNSFLDIKLGSDIDEAVLMLGNPLDDKGEPCYKKILLDDDVKSIKSDIDFRCWIRANIFSYSYAYILGSDENKKIVFKKEVSIDD